MRVMREYGVASRDASECNLDSLRTPAGKLLYRDATQR